MKFRLFIIILCFFCWAFDVRAQLPEELSSSSLPEQWQLTLDVIKSKAQTLVGKNNGLQDQYRELIGQVQKLRQSIDEQQYKNERISRLLKDRHGRTDQQARIDELTQIIKAKDQRVDAFDGQLANFQRKKSEMDRQIQELKDTISKEELRQQSEADKAQNSPSVAQPQGEDQLSPLHKQMEDESRQEVLLERELAALKTGGQIQNLNVDAVESDNKQLEARLDMLRLQKLRHQRQSSDDQWAQAGGRMYNKLKMRKEELESKIYAYELRMDDLRQGSLLALSWPLKKKQLVHEMVQVDARNNQMRNKIKDLREDIDVLRDQVAKLERQVNFVQGKDETH